MPVRMLPAPYARPSVGAVAAMLHAPLPTLYPLPLPSQVTHCLRLMLTLPFMRCSLFQVQPHLGHVSAPLNPNHPLP